MSRRQSWRVAPLAGNRRYELYMNLKTVLEDEGGLDLLDDNALAADLACFGFKVHERRKTFAGNVTVEGRHVIVDGGRDADRPICRVIAQIRPSQKWRRRRPRPISVSAAYPASTYRTPSPSRSPSQAERAQVIAASSDFRQGQRPRRLQGAAELSKELQRLGFNDDAS